MVDCRSASVGPPALPVSSVDLTRGPTLPADAQALRLFSPPHTYTYADRQQQRRATSRPASRCSYDFGNDDGRLQQGKGSARALHPEAGPAHIRATSLPLFVPR